MSQIIKKLEELEDKKADTLFKDQLSEAPKQSETTIAPKSYRNLILIALTVTIVIAGAVGLYFQKTRNKPTESSVIKKEEIDISEINNNVIMAFNQKNYKKALATIQPLLNKNITNKHIEILSNLAVIYRRMNKYDESIEILDQLISVNEKNSTLYNNRGTVFLAQGKHNLAKNDFLKAVQIDPKNNDARLNLGLTYESLKDWTKAKEQYERYITSLSSDMKITNILKKRLIQINPLQIFQEKK